MKRSCTIRGGRHGGHEKCNDFIVRIKSFTSMKIINLSCECSHPLHQTTAREAEETNSRPMHLLMRRVATTRSNIKHITLRPHIRCSSAPLPIYYSPISHHCAMATKRSAPGSSRSSKAKRQQLKQVDYCDVDPCKDDDGSIIWPAPEISMEQARDFLRECVDEKGKVLIVPDKDADGLSSGVIVHRTLTTLGLDPELIEVHLLQKGTTIHDDGERKSMAAKEPKFIVVLDQGGRPARPVVDDPEVRVLILDHHLSDEYPERALVVSACHYPPVATTSLLTYEICKSLHPEVSSSCSHLCAIGTIGDLGTTLQWKPPFPDMTQTFKDHTKKMINDTVASINAPRRTAEFDVISAWDALLNATALKDIVTNRRLQHARDEIAIETEKRSHSPPKFTKDGRFAVLKINSGAQVHPIIATRWAGFLSAKKLEVIMVANYGYLPDLVNFSCRVARSARNKDPAVNIIESLKGYAALSDQNLIARMGSSFARGHKEASGGIVPVAEFEELMTLMQVGVKPDPGPDAVPSKNQKAIAPQSNNLMNYFARA